MDTSSFIIGLILGPVILFTVLFIYLHFSAKKRDASLRAKIKKYTREENKEFLGEFPTVPQRTKHERRNRRY